MHDVAIVGAGPAGLALAYYLRDLDLDVSILEASHDVGGRTKSVDLAGAPVNTGAMFIYRGTRAEELAVELGQRTAPFVPTTYGVHLNGTTSVAETNEEVVGGLPLGAASQSALLGFMREIVAEYAANTAGGAMTDDADALASQTVAERLQGLPEDARTVVEAAVRGGSVGDSSQLSAKYALRYLGSYMAREPENRLYPVAGMQELPRELARRLGPRTTIRCGTKVKAIQQVEGAFEIHTVVAGEQQVRRARRVVVTVPAPLVAGLCPRLPAWKLSALHAAKTPGSSTLTVAANIKGLPEFARWSFVSTAGKAFDAIINPLPGVIPQDGIVRFTCYGNSAGFIPGFSDDSRQIASWVDDFVSVAPALRERIVSVHAETWKHCFSILSPSRAQALPDLKRPVGDLHFAGDYTSATAGSHGAYDEAFRVAAEVRGRLGVGQPPVPEAPPVPQAPALAPSPSTL